MPDPSDASKKGDILSPSNSAAAAGMAFGTVLSLLAPPIPGMAVIGGIVGALAGEKIGRLATSRAHAESQERDAELLNARVAAAKELENHLG